MTNSAIPDVIAYGLSHWRLLGRRSIPLSDDLTISTRNDRIEVAHPDLGALSLTTEQSIALRERLEQAELDIDVAEPCEEGGDLRSPARCDCCSRAMAVGEQVAVHWDERIGDVVMHAGKCPESEMWQVQWTYRSGETGLTTRGRCAEDAYVYAIDFKARYPDIPRVRLVRVREARP